MKKMLKKIAFTVLAFSLLGLFSCSNTSSGGSITPNNPAPNNPTSNNEAEGKTLEVWTYNNDLQTIIDKYYKPGHPDITVKLTVVPKDQFSAKLDAALAAGAGTPDLFVLNSDIAKKYIDKGDSQLLDLTEIYNESKSKIVPYIADVGMKDGKVYGLSWQACPGAYFYRRSLAKKYLGSDDPATVQKAFANWDTFLKTARDLKKASGGKCVILSTTGDLFKPFQGARKGPWIQGGKLVVDPAMEDYMEMAKTLKDEGLEGRQERGAEGWFAGFKDELKDEVGRPVEVFGVFLSSCEFLEKLKPNAGNTAGDWGMIAGPNQYFSGGEWIAAYAKTKAPKLAKEFIKYIATDDEFLKKWSKDTGNIVSSKNAVNAIKDTCNETFLNGQNYYAEFAAIVNNIDGKVIQGTDQDIEKFWDGAVWSYVNGEKSKQDAIADFKTNVAQNLGFQSK